MKLASALVVENTGVRVSSAKGRVWSRSAQPPIRSTTISPSMARAKRAPNSSPAAKLAAKASRTAANLGGQTPRISTSATHRLQPHPRRGFEAGRQSVHRRIGVAGGRDQLRQSADRGVEGVRRGEPLDQ